MTLVLTGMPDGTSIAFHALLLYLWISVHDYVRIIVPIDIIPQPNY